MESTPNARFYTFVGDVMWTINDSTPSARFSMFVGDVMWTINDSTPCARFSMFDNTLAYGGSSGPSGGTNTGTVLYPISEDPTQRPILRY